MTNTGIISDYFGMKRIVDFSEPMGVAFIALGVRGATFLGHIDGAFSYALTDAAMKKLRASGYIMKLDDRNA